MQTFFSALKPLAQLPMGGSPHHCLPPSLGLRLGFSQTNLHHTSFHLCSSVSVEDFSRINGSAGPSPIPIVSASRRLRGRCARILNYTDQPLLFAPFLFFFSFFLSVLKFFVPEWLLSFSPHAKNSPHLIDAGLTTVLPLLG